MTLPEKYRAALVLCHLQGWSRREAADRLGCPEGTLSSLLSRGLTRLRAKLAGHDPFPLLAVPVLSVPAALSSATARAACAARFSAALFPVTVSHLAEGVLRMFWVKKATAATMALVAVFAFGIGVGMNAQYGSRSAAQDTAKPDSSKSLPAPVLDYDKAIAKIRSDIGGWEATVGTVGPQADVFQKQLEQLLKDTPGDTKAIASLREAVPKFRETVANVEKRIREAQAQIKTLEAAKRAAQSPNRTKADADLEAEAARIILAQLRADRDQLQGQSLHHTRQSEDFKQKAADSDAKARQVADLIQQLETRRSDTAPVAKGAGLEVTIIDEKGLWPFTVKEYDAKTGKLIGTLICDTADILTVTLSRVMKDPAGPRDLKITVQANTPYERVRAVLEACHKAGFKEAKVSGPLPIRKLGEPVREYLVDEVTIPNLRFEYTERKEPINIDDLLKMFQPKK